MNESQKQSLKSLSKVLQKGLVLTETKQYYSFNEKMVNKIILKMKRFDNANPGFLDGRHGKACKLNHILRYEIGFSSNDDIYEIAQRAFNEKD